MTKRDAPESGFEPTSSAKRQASADSIQPKPSPPPRDSSLPSVTQPASFADTEPNHHVEEDAFLPDSLLADAADDDDFVLNDNQKNELAKELSGLQSMPTTAIDEISNPSVIPDEESQEEDNASEKPTSTTSSGRKTEKNKDKSKTKRRTRFRPILWSDGTPDSEAAWIARKADGLICGTTNITLDTEPLLVNGTLWKEVLLDELPDLLRSDDRLPFPPAQDKFDFLKACFRLGIFIEPNRMSRLLGGGYRSPEYCAFLLQGFLGLLHNPKVRRLLNGETKEPSPKKNKDVVVYGDQLYPSDDELLVDQETEAPNSQPDSVPQDGQAQVGTIEESDREEDEDHEDPPHIQQATVHETRHKQSAEQRFFAKPSYVLRNYMSIVTGQQFNNIDDFETYRRKVGATSSPGRLKWLKERMPAPELGPERAVSEPMELWKHALGTYSVKNLSRCALIRINPLLDWLGFVAHEAEPATSEAEYYRVNRPVVAIAPIPLLYLAEKAADFALRVLGTALQTEELNPVTEEEDAPHLVIDHDDITSAAQYLEQDPIQRQRNYLCALDTAVLGGEQSCSRDWPTLVQRPLTRSETIELCDRAPKASVSIPNSITDEMRAVMMSFRRYVRTRVYFNPKLFQNMDPLAYMSPKEKKECMNKRWERNRAHGIKWFQKGAQEEGEDDEDGNERDPASPTKQTVMQMSSAQENKKTEKSDTCPIHVAEQTEDRKNRAVPAKPDMQQAEKVPEFFDQVNVAELIAFRLGDNDAQGRRGVALKLDSEDCVSSDAPQFLKESVNNKKTTGTTVCFHRLGWICLHALGNATDKDSSNTRPMGYGSCANYTNFAQLCPKKPVVLTARALYSLAQLADAVVRHEANVLMACAAHDEGRPWIDRADVALVTSVRKEDFNYRNL